MKLAEKEKLKPMELELRKLEDLVKDVIEDMEHLQRREEKMRNTNGNDIWITPGTCWILEYICFRDIALGVVLCADTIRLFSSLLMCFLESTNARVQWFSTMTMVVLIALGAWQIVYLKQFFRKKRLID